MDFRSFFYGLNAEGRQNFAAAVETSVGYLNLIASGHKRCGETLALKIESKSEAAVTVEEIRPDVPWHVVRGKPCHGPKKAA